MFTNIVELSTVMRRARITLYSVSTPGPLDQATYYEGYVKGVTAPDKVQTANLALQVLAVQSGGRVLNRSNSLAEEIANCVADGKVYYTLAFDAPTAAHRNEYHALQIKMNKPGLTSRTRTGYYAQP
jgi:VWFA-related protein